MSEKHLDELNDTLMEIPVEDVTAPTIPLAVVLQEANDLLTLIRDPPIRARLGAVGLDASAAERLEKGIGAARVAHSRWVVMRDRSKTEAQRQREERGQTLRAELMAACRWALRGSRVAQGTLSAIAEGEGVADLVQDLHDIAELIRQNGPAFASDSTFDAAAAMESAVSLATEIAAGTSSQRLDTNQAAAKGLRDRAYTYLASVVAEIREAGRYAHRKEPRVAQRFASSFLRRRRRMQATVSVPATPADPAT